MRRFKSWIEGILVGLMVLTLTLLTLGFMLRFLLPDLSSQKQEIEEYLSTSFNAKIQIDSLSLRFSGIEPALLLEGVHIKKEDFEFRSKKVLAHLHVMRTLAANGWRILHWPVPDLLSGDLELDAVQFTHDEKRIAFHHLETDLHFKHMGDETSIMLSRLAIAKTQETKIPTFFLKLSLFDTTENLSYAIQAKDVPLALGYLIEPVLPLSVDIKRLINKTNPRGMITQLALAASDTDLKFFSATFQDFSSNVYLDYPALTGAAFQIDYAPGKGNIHFLGVKESGFYFPKIFEKPIKTTALFGDINFWIQPDRVVLKSEGVKIELPDAKLMANFTFDTKEASLSLQSKIEGNVTSLNALIPHVLPDETYTWLTHAFVEGKVHAADLIFEGKIAEFPFQKYEGTFRFAAAADDLTLSFDPEWPTLTHLDGVVFGDGCTLSMSVPLGETVGGKVKNVKATLTDLCTHNVPAHLSVKGTAISTLEKGSEYMLLTPLKKPLGEALATLEPTGPLNLNLDLNIAISEKEVNTLVEGFIKTTKATITVPETKFKLEDIEGEFAFTERGLATEGVEGTLKNIPVHIVIDSQEEQAVPKMLISVLAHPSVTDLEKAFETKLSDKVEGATEILTRITVPFVEPMDPQVTFESDLKGLAILLPAPLKKGKEESRHFLAEPISEKGKMLGWYLSFDKTLNIALGEPQSNGLFPINLHFGDKKVPLPAVPGLFISGTIDEFSLGDQAELSTSETGELPFLGASVTIARLKMAETTFQNVDVNLKKEKGFTKIHLNAPTLGGTVILPDKAGSQETSVILDRLIVAFDASKKKEHAVHSSDLKRVLPLRFSVNQLKVNDTPLGALSVSLIPTKGEDLTIQHLKIEGPLFKLAGEGHWLKDSSQLEGDMTTNNLGQLLSVFADSKVLQATPSHFNYVLSWPDSPFDFSLKKATGKVNASLKEGQLLGVEPGLGRLFSLLSIDEWQRRIRLNFNDVIKKGFAFTSVEGNFILTSGNAVTEKTHLKGSAADLEMKGAMNLAESTLNLDVLVTPNVNAGLPIAAAVAAANPAVGAAVWVFDKLFAPEIGKIAQNRYLVTGSFQKPDVQRVGLQNRVDKNQKRPSN